jgi:hypothetical protein
MQRDMHNVLMFEVDVDEDRNHVMRGEGKIINQMLRFLTRSVFHYFRDLSHSSILMLCKLLLDLF